MEVQSIGEIARQSGVPASTIRYYEELELLPPARRVSGQRRYDDTILQQLNLIQLAKQSTCARQWYTSPSFSTSSMCS